MSAPNFLTALRRPPCRKQHKLLCSKTHTGASALTRPPDIKVAERIFADVDIMCHIDGILIKCLDLEHHPENAEKYAVALSCRVELTDTRRAADRISYFMRGEEPPPLPERLPKLFQIGKATLIPNESVPPSLDETVERQRKTLEEAGFFQHGCKQIMVRCMWVSEQSKWATCYYPRLVTPKMIQVAAGLTRPDSDEPMTTEDLIEYTLSSPGPYDTLLTLLRRLFDVCALADPERNKKLTIVSKNLLSANNQRDSSV